MSPVVAFTADLAPDARGRMRRDILAWPDRQLEGVHDYIQWLFPLPERSAYNMDAPLLTTADVAAFAEGLALRANLAESHRRMLAFYRLGAGPRHWTGPGDHNHLRITRILRCLALLGLQAEARAMLAQLQALPAAELAAVGSRSQDFWARAVQP